MSRDIPLNPPLPPRTSVPHKAYCGDCGHVMIAQSADALDQAMADHLGYRGGAQ